MNDRMINFYISIAESCSKMSRAVRLQVGCVIVKNNNIISFSWNGTPTGWDNTCEDIEITFDERETYYSPDWKFDEKEKKYYRLKTKPEVLHAESNAISKLARSSESGLDSDMFITHSPCIDCAKLIFQAGVRRVFYSEDYRSRAGVEFLEKSGVTVEKITR